MTQTKAALPSWAVPCILAASLPATLAAQQATVQSPNPPPDSESSFVRWIDGERCYASSAAWRMFTNRTGTEVYYRLEDELRRRMNPQWDWRLADPPGLGAGESLISHLKDRGGGEYVAFAYLSTLTYELSSERVEHGGEDMGYWVTATETRGSAPRAGTQGYPYPHTELWMGDAFASLIVPELTPASATGAAAARPTGYRLGIYGEFRSRTATGEWGEWRGRALDIDLPTGGLADAIRETMSCAAKLR